MFQSFALSATFSFFLKAISALNGLRSGFSFYFILISLWAAAGLQDTEEPHRESVRGLLVLPLSSMYSDLVTIKPLLWVGVGGDLHGFSLQESLDSLVHLKVL